MQNIDGTGNKRIMILTDIALLLISGVAACLYSVGLSFIGIIIFGVTAALFATVPHTHTVPQSIISVAAVLAIPLVFTLATLNPATLIYSCAVVLSGFAVAILSSMKQKRTYSVAISAALFAIAAALVFIPELTRYYGAGISKSADMFFDGIKTTLGQYTASIFELAEKTYDIGELSQNFELVISVAVEQMKLKFIGGIGFVLVLFAYLITELYRAFCRLLGVYDRRFDRSVWSLNASGAMCVMFIVFSIISFFSVSRYNSASGLSTMQLILTGLANLAMIFGGFMLIQGIRRYITFIKTAKEKSNGIYVASIAVLIIGALLDIVTMVKIICYFGAFNFGHDTAVKGDDGVGKEKR